MRKLLVFLSLIAIAIPVSAQETKAPKPKVVAKAGEKPAADAPKRSVIGRIFGRKPAPAAPVPTPTPAPVVKPRQKAKSRPKASTEKPEEPTTEKANEGPAETPAAKPEVKPTVGKRGIKKNPPPVPAPAEGDDKAKYTAAREKADEDAAVKELKGKADNALTEAEAHTTSVAYNKAVYKKIREIDPSLDAYVDKLEEVMMKRLNSEKKAE
jgi:hypothetical protein